MAKHKLLKINQQVNMYVCGPTVYNHLHIGNIRSTITFDMIKNALIATGYDVKYIQNITDINEKIEAQAIIENTTIDHISQKYTDAFLELLNKLNIDYTTNQIKPNTMNIVSIKTKINQIFNFTKKLIDNGFTYQTNDGIYLKTDLINNYGKHVANRDVDQNDKGIRITNQEKQNENDFVLFKFTKTNSFKTSFGEGVPGWHTECAAIIDDEFNSETIDIHGGGVDLKFPHHENESAQYYAANQTLMAQNWLHNGHLSIDGDKMSKSVGNVILAKDLLNKYSSAQLRLWLASVDFQKPLNFSAQTLEDFKKVEQKVIILLSQQQKLPEARLSAEMNETVKALDFPSLIDYINQSPKVLNENIDQVIAILQVLGIKFIPHQLTSEISEMIEKRNQAKLAKDYQQADKIKNQIKELENGIELIDSQKNGDPVSYILGKLK